MKILFLKDKRSPTGIEGSATYLFRMCKVLNKMKIPYLVLYNGKNDYYFKTLKKNNIKIRFINFPKETPKNFFRFNQIKILREKIDKLILKGNYSLINTHFPHLNNFINPNIKIPVFTHWHGAQYKNDPLKVFSRNFIDNFNLRNLLFSAYRKFKIFNFNLSHKVIAVSNASKNTACKSFLVDKKKILINRYGVERYNVNKVGTINKEFNIPNDAKIILSAGRITRDKGVEEFCEIAKKLANKKLKFFFLGGYRSEEYYKNILKKYSKYVTFPGMRSDIEKFYKSSHIFLFLSHRESAGMVLMEAMNFKLPIVAWNIIGVNEIVKNNHNGLLIRFGCKNKAILAIKKLISDKKKYNLLSENSFRSFDNYNINKSVENLIDIFNEKKPKKN